MFYIFFEVVSIPYEISCMPEIFSSISCILLLMLASVAPDPFSRFFISMVASICDFFVVYTSIFKSWKLCSIPLPV